MASWGKAERETCRLLQPLDINDLHDQLDTIRSHLKELSHAFSRATHHQLGRARALHRKRHTMPRRPCTITSPRRCSWHSALACSWAT